MTIEIENSILKTIAYSDIFNYSLTEDEICNFLIGNKKIDKDLISSRLLFLRSSDNSKVIFNKGFYCFKNRRSCINKRIKREKESRRKFILAKKIISILSIIPTIQLIGISGGLSMNNCDKNDDIDLFVVTKSSSLWKTRLFLLLILQVLKKRRKRFDKKIKDKICLNLLVDENNLDFKKEKQNLYTAHEIMQMIPVFEKNDMYDKFIKSNIWVKKFLPNSIKYRVNCHTKKNNISILAVFLSFFLSIPVGELLAKYVQYFYMKKHITKEIISDHVLAFYPVDQKEKTLKIYNKNLKKYNI